MKGKKCFKNALIEGGTINVVMMKIHNEILYTKSDICHCTQENV